MSKTRKAVKRTRKPARAEKPKSTRARKAIIAGAGVAAASAAGYIAYRKLKRKK